LDAFRHGMKSCARTLTGVPAGLQDRHAERLNPPNSQGKAALQLGR